MKPQMEKNWCVRRPDTETELTVWRQTIFILLVTYSKGTHTNLESYPYQGIYNDKVYISPTAPRDCKVYTLTEYLLLTNQEDKIPPLKECKKGDWIMVRGSNNEFAYQAQTNLHEKFKKDGNSNIRQAAFWEIPVEQIRDQISNNKDVPYDKISELDRLICNLQERVGKLEAELREQDDLSERVSSLEILFNAYKEAKVISNEQDKSGLFEPETKEPQIPDGWRVLGKYKLAYKSKGDKFWSDDKKKWILTRYEGGRDKPFTYIRKIEKEVYTSLEEIKSLLDKGVAYVWIINKLENTIKAGYTLQRGLPEDVRHLLSAMGEYADIYEESKPFGDRAKELLEKYKK
jgi:hypothetical protein